MMENLETLLQGNYYSKFKLGDKVMFRGDGEIIATISAVCFRSTEDEKYSIEYYVSYWQNGVIKIWVDFQDIVPVNASTGNNTTVHSH
jgi:hypothetical protein